MSYKAHISDLDLVHTTLRRGAHFRRHDLWLLDISSLRELMHPGRVLVNWLFELTAATGR